MKLWIVVPGEKTKTKLSKRLKHYFKKFWALRSKVTVEPYLICYVLPSILAGFAVQNLCLEKSCLVDLHYDEETCSDIKEGRSQNHIEEEENVERMVASMTASSFPVQTGLPEMLALFMGAWSDRTANRKFFMVVPILGKFISAISIILSTFFFREVGANETALMESMPSVLAGGRVAMTMAVYSYITDITGETERTFRLGIISSIISLSRPLGIALSEIIVCHFGYYGILSTACVWYLIGFVYIVLRLKEKTNKGRQRSEEEPTSSVMSASPVNDLVSTMNVVFRVREGTRRVQMILILIAYMFVVGPVLGKYFLNYYLKHILISFYQ